MILQEKEEPLDKALYRLTQASSFSFSYLEPGGEDTHAERGGIQLRPARKEDSLRRRKG